jgi:hypothetical protein
MVVELSPLAPRVTVSVPPTVAAKLVVVVAVVAAVGVLEEAVVAVVAAVGILVEVVVAAGPVVACVLEEAPVEALPLFELQAAKKNTEKIQTATDIFKNILFIMDTGSLSGIALI